MNKDNEIQPLSGLQIFFMTIGLGIGTFIQILDTSIANVSIPSIAGDLGVSPDQGTWVITSFAVSNAIVLPLTGWLTTRFGQVRLFVWSVILFSITSALCGLSQFFSMLVFFRVLQGAVAGSLIPLSQSLLLINYPPDKKTTALSIWVMIVVIAPIMGPILGGWITDNYGWEWIFYINVPTGIVSAVLTWMLLHKRESKITKIPTDVIGFILLIIGVGALQVLLDKGKDLDWFNSNVICLLAVVSFIAFLFFTVWNSLSKYPVIDFTFFRSHNFTLCTILISLGYMIFFGSVVLYPLILQTQLNYTPFMSGVAISPIGVFPFTLSMLVGKLCRMIDLRIIITFSFLAFFYSFTLFSNLTTDASLYEFMLPPLMLGFAMAFFFIPLTTLSLQEIPPEKFSSASGVFTFLRIFAGGGIGTALFITLEDRRERFFQSRLVEWINPYRSNVRRTMEFIQEHLNLSPDSTKALVNRIVEQQASMLATNDIFYAASWVFIILIPLIWFCTPKKEETLLQEVTAGH